MGSTNLNGNSIFAFPTTDAQPRWNIYCFLWGWLNQGMQSAHCGVKLYVGFQLLASGDPLIPALFKSQYFFPAASCFLLVFTSLSTGVTLLTSTASALTSLQYSLPDSLHGDSFYLTLVCSLSIANTSVSLLFKSLY